MLPSWSIKAIAILALVAAILFGVNSYNEHQRDAGRAECKAAVAEATVKAVAEALVKERKGTEVQALVQAKLNKDLKDESAKKDSVITKLRSGTLVLRDPNSTCNGRMPAATAGLTGNSAEAGTELSNTTSEFLISEAGRADQVVLQLQACQAVLVNDRKTVNGRIQQN